MRKVTIIGAGPGNPDLLSRAALDAIDFADVVIGAHRALAGIDVPPDVVRCELVKTADIVAALTDAASWRRAVVVMTGDVGLFSGARRLVEALSGDAQVDVRVVPGISSASYLAARLACPWQDWRFASAHGVACDIVAEAERAGELFLVTSGGEDPSRLSGELVHAGFGDARVTVAERLSYPDERITCATASEIAGQTFDDLNVMLIEFAGGAGSPEGSSAASEAPAGASAPAADSAGASRAASSRWPYASSGIPDELFIRGDVPMTKQEVRAVALAKLCLTATDTVWDVGAGTGSINEVMQRYQTKLVEVVNRSKMGATIRKGLSLVRHDLDRGLEARYALVSYGGNDSDYDWAAIDADPGADHRPNTELPVFADTLHETLDALRQGGVQPVMMTLPPIDGERYLDFLCRDNLRRDRILDWLGEPQMIYRHQELYADTAAEIALRENIPLIPVRQTFLCNHRLSELIAADGIHLTMPGYERLFDTLADWVKKNI